MFSSNSLDFTKFVHNWSSMQIQCNPSMVQCSKHAKTYVYCTVLTMMASNTNNDLPTINYSRLLTKLKAELPETTPKKTRIEKKLFPTEAQRRLLDVCGYQDFLNPPGFDTIWKVNQFVTEHAEYIKEFEKKHGGMPCPCIVHFMSRIQWLFSTLTA